MTSCAERRPMGRAWGQMSTLPAPPAANTTARPPRNGAKGGRLRVAMVSVHTCPLAKLGSRETGGMNVYVRELSRHLGARGVEVDVFTRRQDNGTPRVVEFGENARVIHLEAGPNRPMDKYRVLEHLPQFLQGIREFSAESDRRYDVVHSHYWLSGPVAGALAREEGLPLVTMFHTLGHLKNRVSTNGHEREQRTRMEIERAAMVDSDRLVAASPTDRDQMVDFYHADASNIRVIPAGVDSQLFRPLPKATARSILDMGPEPQILFVGRIQALKGIDLLIRAFARLLAGWGEEPAPRLTVVGGRRSSDGTDPEAWEMDRLKALSIELGIGDRLQFREAVPHHQLPLHYSAADVVVVPSLYESFGLVALESMACGTPVVAARVGGLQWTVQHGKTGFLVPQRSPERYASAVGALLRDGALRERMSASAVEVAKEYSWSAVAEKVLDLYREMSGRGAQQMAACAR